MIITTQQLFKENIEKDFVDHIASRLEAKPEDFLVWIKLIKDLFPHMLDINTLHPKWSYKRKLLKVDHMWMQVINYLKLVTGGAWRNIDLEVILSPGEYIVHTIVDYRGD